MTAAAVSFDRQAADFDRRAGLPPGVAPRIAGALAELAPAGGALLDLGAGTGLVGEHLAGGVSRYLGMDVSGPMLAVFRRKLAGRARGAALVRADAAAPWPLADGRVGLVFVSRAAHLLPTAVLVAETLRVARREGALFVLGGVEGDRDSLRAVLRRQMRRLLAERGVEPRRAGEARRAIADALAARGGEVLAVRTAATWPVVHRAADALAAWRAKAGLAGRPVAPEVQEEVLGKLESWIRERYGSLDVERETRERYDLLAVRLPPRSATDEGGNA